MNDNPTKKPIPPPGETGSEYDEETGRLEDPDDDDENQENEQDGGQTDAAHREPPIVSGTGLDRVVSLPGPTYYLTMPRALRSVETCWEAATATPLRQGLVTCAGTPI